MRTWLAVVASVLIVALGLSACAGPPRPVVLDPEANGRLTVEGFREASEVVSARLETALAWAVFPDVEDASEVCTHAGMLFQAGAPPRPVVLTCTVRPSAPAGAAYHLLVVLEEPEVLARLARDGLELGDVPHLTTHDEQPPPASGPVWVVTSQRATLLFDTWAPRQRLALAAGT